jgi:RNA polymerase sigma-70 factor (ECF subfamily)
MPLTSAASSDRTSRRTCLHPRRHWTEVAPRERKTAGVCVFLYVGGPSQPVRASTTQRFLRPARQVRRSAPPSLERHCGILWPILPAVDLRRLLEDCLSGRQEGWTKFVAYCQPTIQAAVVRSIRRCGTPTPELAEDLVQDTYMRLCADNYRILRDVRFFESAGINGLLEAVAVSVTFDYFRRRIAKKRGSGQQPISIDQAKEIPTADPEGQRRTERHVLFGEIDRHLRAISAPENAARDRRVFWLYYHHGFSAKEIAALAGVSLTPKGAESILHRLTAQLKEVFDEFPEFEK